MASTRTLSNAEARSVYDRIGAGQDLQAFYEDLVTRVVLAHGLFAAASAVFEFGCGTGRFARSLLHEHLSPTATYHGVDLSPTMVRLAERKLADVSTRAHVVVTDGTPPTAEASASCDRFVSNFVLDLLSDQQIDGVLAEAHRMLRPGGLLCLASLSPGHGAISRAVIGAWSLLHRLHPALVAGCRPIEIGGFLAAGDWRIRYRESLAPFGLPSEVVIAERGPGAG